MTISVCPIPTTTEQTPDGQVPGLAAVESKTISMNPDQTQLTT